MTVLVTGSSGRIGSLVVKLLLDSGICVRGFDVRRSGRKSEYYEEIVGLLEDWTATKRAVSGVQDILHLGALMSWNPKDNQKLFRSNVNGTYVLLSLAAENNVNKVVFASSGQVYPEDKTTDLPITEDHPLNTTTAYGISKLLGEELVKYFGRISSFATVILRFSHTQDARELLDENSFFSGPRFFLHSRIRQQEDLGNVNITNILRTLDPGKPALILGCNASGRPFRMHITETRDIAQGVMLALKNPKANGEIYNLGSTDSIDCKDLLKEMSKITTLPVVTVNLPGIDVFYKTSNEKIRKELGFAPQWTMDRMLQEASQVWSERLARISHKTI